jgi:hypothetical protein
MRYIALVLVWIGSAWPISAQNVEPAAAPIANQCDLLAGHPLDPDKVGPGRSRDEIVAAGVQGAIAACQAEVARDPTPRALYQLGRVLAYAGQPTESAVYIERAVAGNYTQALFVRGYQLINGLGVARDACRAMTFIRKSADQGRTAGMIALPHHALLGDFASCPGAPTKIELLAYVAQARAADAGDYGRGLFYDQLVFQLNRLP